MKNKLWLLQIPFVILATLSFYVSELGVRGELENKFLREKAYPALKSVSTWFTDRKFRIRGPTQPKNKIVIIEVDSPSIETLGRWPWHRDVIAMLINKTFEAGARVVGLDMVFSEPDQRMPSELAALLQQKKMGELVQQFETDRVLEGEIARHRERLVVGWATEQSCQPLYSSAEECPVMNPDAIAAFPQGVEKFSFTQFDSPSAFDPLKTPFVSLFGFLANIPQFTAVASHSGFFNADTDPDGYVRRSNMIMVANKRPYPSLPLEMARVGLGDDLKLTLDAKQRVKTIGFLKSGKEIPVTPLGVMDINFRGPGRTFTYVSALDVLSDSDTLKDELNRKLAGASKKEVLKDAYVLIGVSALGVYDMRAFPFDSNVPGVEGHASILDNVLAGDAMINSAITHHSIWIYLIMIVGALVFSYFAQKLEAVPALLFFLVGFGSFGFVDVRLLFENQQNWNTSFVYLEMMAIFMVTVAAKYVMEERNKKFIRGAFAKYVAPAVVDSILKDPTKLQVGGEKRDLTIMFSDIRSFTTFSERLDAKKLAALLNDYLGIMTNIVFAHEGTLDKYIGDAIMAFWGAPLDQKNHAENACKTAMAMMKALGEHKPRFKEQYGVDVEIGVGLNSGVVNVGNMGSENNFAYTVIGDHVNLSSRLEGLTKAYGVGILTSRYTFDDIQAAGGTLPPHRILDNVKVKGKATAVELIELLYQPLNEEGLRVFQEGRTLYTQQKWDAAIAKLQEASRLLAASPEKMDGPSGVFIERCEHFKQEPPAPDWDGSWKMESK